MIPLIVVIAGAIFAFLLPRLLTKGRQISYSIDEPITLLRTEMLASVDLRVNGEKVSQLYAYGIRVWNSGDDPIKELPILLTFQPRQPGFKIYRVTHATKPLHEFGRIQEDSTKPSEMRFIYALLNAGDEDHLTLLSNQQFGLNLYSKAEGLRVKKEEPPKQTSAPADRSIIIAALASLFSLAAKWLADARSTP